MPGEPGAGELLKQIKVRSLRVALRLDGGPDAWFPQAQPERPPPVLNERGGAAVAERILETFRRSTALKPPVLSGKLSN
jgi:hypothetical protein